MTGYDYKNMNANMNERQNEFLKGRSTPEEHALFKMAYHTYGNDWKKLASIIKTRSICRYVLMLKSTAVSLI